MHVTEVLELLANDASVNSEFTKTSVVAYEMLSRMHNLLISVDVAFDAVYPTYAPKPIDILRPIVKEII